MKTHSGLVLLGSGLFNIIVTAYNAFAAMERSSARLCHATSRLAIVVTWMTLMTLFIIVLHNVDAQSLGRETSGSHTNSSELEEIPGIDLSAFVDGMMDIQLKRDDAAGAVVYISQNGRVLLDHGYGLADVAAHRAVDSNATLFRGGDISNLFTTVAVLQLVEQGRLALDRDVNAYLDFVIPSTFEKPITLRSLLSQTSGLAPAAAITMPDTSSAIKTYLLQNLPRRLYPPDTVPAKTDYGMALAAYIVTRASGLQYPEYVEKNIFLPLGMHHSSFQQPLPAELAPNLSRDYHVSTQSPLFRERVAPASNALTTTATDMGRFGEMLLHSGQLEGWRILSPEYVREMLARQYGPVPMLPGMCLGFHQIWFNQHRFYGIAGDMRDFHSEMEIDPDDGLVIFLAYNSSGIHDHLRRYSRGEIIHGILDRYYPYHPTVKILTPTQADKQYLTGTWLPSREIRQCAGLSSNVLYRSWFDRNDTLRIDRFVSDRKTIKVWNKIATDVWQQYPQDRIAFLPASRDHPDMLLLAATPDIALIKVH